MRDDSQYREKTVNEMIQDDLSASSFWERARERKILTEVASGWVNQSSELVDQHSSYPFWRFSDSAASGIFVDFALVVRRSAQRLELTGDNQLDELDRFAFSILGQYEGLKAWCEQLLKSGSVVTFHQLTEAMLDSLKLRTLEETTRCMGGSLPIKMKSGEISTALGLDSLDPLPQDDGTNPEYNRINGQREVVYLLSQVLNDGELSVEVRGTEGEGVDPLKSLTFLREVSGMLVNEGIVRDSLGQQYCPLDLLISSSMKLEDIAEAIGMTLAQMKLGKNLKELNGRLGVLMLGAYVTQFIGRVAYAQTSAAAACCRHYLGSGEFSSDLPHGLSSKVEQIAASLDSRSYPLSEKSTVYYDEEWRSYEWRGLPEDEEVYESGGWIGPAVDRILNEPDPFPTSDDLGIRD